MLDGLTRGKKRAAAIAKTRIVPERFPSEFVARIPEEQDRPNDSRGVQRVTKLFGPSEVDKLSAVELDECLSDPGKVGNLE